MTDKNLEKDLLKQNYYYKLYFVNYKDFNNSIGTPLGYFTISMNTTLFFSPQK